MSDQTIQMAFDNLFEDGLITELNYTVKSGKEATVFCCKAGDTLDDEYVAVKVYRPRQFRSFKNDNSYQAGRVKDKRMRKAFKKKTRKWHQYQEVSWVSEEFETMCLLYTAGVNIPRPYDCAHGAIIMEYLGDEDGPAIQLKDVRLDQRQAQPLFDALIRDIALALACNRIHADLSPFNILYWNGSLVIIDFPQAVDPYSNSNAFTMFARDIDNVCAYFNRYGVDADAYFLARRLWFEAGF
ncbi:MAG: RIO1 family regulatory kinase/ATPase [Chloroflexota bacterium]